MPLLEAVSREARRGKKRQAPKQLGPPPRRAPFTTLIEQKYGCPTHHFSPPHRSTYDSDAEVVDGFIKPEFYPLKKVRESVGKFQNHIYSYFRIEICRLLSFSLAG